MDNNRSILLLSLLAVLLLVTGCGTPEVQAPPEPTAVAQVVPTPMNDPEAISDLVEEIKTGAAEGAAAETDDSTPEETVAEAPITKVDYCIECHTDQQALIDTAKPQEEIHSENEGEG
jgi:hypothetical protein